MTPDEKEKQKQYVRSVMEDSGLDAERIAALLGRVTNTVEKWRWADNPLSPKNRRKLQEIRMRYSNGVPKFGVPVGARAKLKAAREAEGLSYAQLAKLTGRPVSILEQLENGTIKISEDHIEALCQHLPGLSPDDLKDGSDHPHILDETGMEATYGAKPSMNLPPGMKGRYVPLLSLGQAGQWDSDHSDALYDYTGIFAPNVDDRRAFAIKVSGNSMEPELRDGDLVICSPQTPISNGDAAVVRTKSEQVFIKYWRKNGERVVLESANADYKPIEFPVDELAGVWPIVQHISSRKITRAR